MFIHWSPEEKFREFALNVVALIVTGQRCQDFAVGISDVAKVRNDQMTASSSLGNANRPYFARIGSAAGDGWCTAQTPGVREYLQVDLEKDFVFCGIMVQGGFHGHVDTFQLEFSRKIGGSFIQYGKVRDLLERFSVLKVIWNRFCFAYQCALWSTLALATHSANQMQNQNHA